MKEEKEEIIRIRLPEGEEMFGIVEQMLGNAWMYVRCQDGKVRLGKIPGKYIKSRLWVRVGDIVIVKPWQVMKDRVFIVHKYTKTETEWLFERGYLKWLEEHE